MLKANAANVIVSALKRPLFIAVLAGLTTAITIGGVFFWNQQRACTITLKQGCVGLETAITPNEQSRGLGGRDSLDADKGMIFIYEQPRRACFWMKDTKFNLDIIWFDASKTITKIESNLSPSTYPRQYCADNTQYVIELNAGSVERNGLAVGQRFNF